MGSIRSATGGNLGPIPVSGFFKSLKVNPMNFSLASEMV
jgi:hypothetical protein